VNLCTRLWALTLNILALLVFPESFVTEFSVAVSDLSLNNRIEKFYFYFVKFQSVALYAKGVVTQKI